MTAGKPMSLLAQANMRVAQQRRRLKERPEHWSVTVSRSGKTIVTIESDCLSGREISAADEQTIRTAAAHLLSFVGTPEGGINWCLQAMASNEPCQPDDTLRRCTICGFIVDLKYAAALGSEKK